MADVWGNSMTCHLSYHIVRCCHMMNSLSWFQSHMPHCRVQSPGEITTRTVVRECCKGDGTSQLMEKPKIWPPPRSNPTKDSHKSWHKWLRRGPLHLCKSSSRFAQGFRFRACVTLHTKSVYSASFFFVFWVLASCNSLQPRPLDGFWRKIRQNTRFRARMCPFGVANIKSNI